VLTDRACRWATIQVGRFGRTVSEVAAEVGCDWHTLNDAVIAYGELIVDHPARIGAVQALGLDETLFYRSGPFHTKNWYTSIVDVGAETAQLLDVVEGRDAKAASRWIEARPVEWRETIRYGALDLSGPYRRTFDDSLPHVTQVADPFHLVRLANDKLDKVRRRVQNELVGHPGRSPDPLYRARRLLVKAHEGLDEKGEKKLRGLLEAGDPGGEVMMAWHAKEVVRAIYDITDYETAKAFVTELYLDLQDDTCPPEVNQLGRTIERWFEQIVAWHKAFVANARTETMNGLVKRIKRIGFGLRNMPQLPSEGAPLRRKTQLGTAGDRGTPLISEAAVKWRPVTVGDRADGWHRADRLLYVKWSGRIAAVPPAG
jgi:transposase